DYLHRRTRGSFLRRDFFDGRRFDGESPRGLGPFAGLDHDGTRGGLARDPDDDTAVLPLLHQAWGLLLAEEHGIVLRRHELPESLTGNGDGDTDRAGIRIDRGRRPRTFPGKDPDENRSEKSPRCQTAKPIHRVN